MKQNTPTERFYLEKNTLDKILFIIGAAGFIVICVFALTYAGFTTLPHNEVKFNIIPTAKTLWLLNIGIGAFSGVLMNYRKFLASIPAGIVTGLSMTAITLAYISFRDSIESFEVLVPLLFGSLIGAAVYNFLCKLIYRSETKIELKK